MSGVGRRKIFAKGFEQKFSLPFAPQPFGKAVGQMVFQFVIAVIVLLVIIIYTVAFLNTNIESYATNMFLNEVESKALIASEVLVKSEGIWSGAIPVSLGLVEKWPVLSMIKIKDLISYCSDEPGKKAVYSLLDLGNYSARILINSTVISSGILCEKPQCICGDSLPSVAKSYMRRYALVYQGGEFKPVTVDVWVWK